MKHAWLPLFSTACGLDMREPGCEVVNAPAVDCPACKAIIVEHALRPDARVCVDCGQPTHDPNWDAFLCASCLRATREQP